MNSLGVFLSPEYLFEVATNTKFEIYYLYGSLAIIAACMGIKFALYLRKREEAYKPFDRLWFWGYLGIGALGLFTWFSRSQGLPVFGTRFFSYLWIFVVLGYAAFLYFYSKKRVKTEVKKYHERSRKEKYLNKK
jgi:amino acid transporter